MESWREMDMKLRREVGVGDRDSGGTSMRGAQVVGRLIHGPREEKRKTSRGNSECRPHS